MKKISLILAAMVLFAGVSFAQDKTTTKTEKSSSTKTEKTTKTEKKGGKKGGKRRAGELYDAFAAGSEDESEEGEYLDGDEGGDEREKKLYEESDEEGKHVIGEDEDEEGEAENEKSAQGERLLHK